MAKEDKNLEKRKVDSPERELTRSSVTFSPDVDIYEDGEVLVLVADMPGVQKDAVDIRLENDTLTITGKTTQADYHGKERIYAEYELGDYYRSFALSEAVGQDGIQASMTDGVLTVRLPKAEKAKARRIEVM